MRMTRKELDQWLEALRSGRFIQGNGALKSMVNKVTQHCCLGVLCELHKDLLIESFDSLNNEWLFNSESMVLPTAIVNKFQSKRNGASIPSNLLTEEEKEMFGNMDYISVAGLNDRGLSFSRIAELLEKVVEIIEEVPA